LDWDNLRFGKRASGDLHLVEDLDLLREGLDRVRHGGHSIALVPTMGNLHDGHLALVRRARELGDLVAATIFVNPFQFGPGEDFENYPRTFEQDLKLLADEGCQLVFAPPGHLVYPHGPDTITRVHVPRIGDIIDGESRPVFFRGVATVVNVLFNMVQPDVAMFGKKDYQQLLVIRRMVADLHLRVHIEAVDTVRHPDGLAMSSRNGYLSDAERAIAPSIHRILQHARSEILAGNRDFSALETGGVRSLNESGLRADYFLIRRNADLEVPGDDDRQLVILAAAFLGSARLIDNVEV
jgi:pantoate--beta-alanine ligase